MHPSFDFLGLKIPAYGSIAILGIAVAALYVIISNKKARLNGTDLLNACVIALVGGLVGAKLLYIVTMLKEFISNFGYYTASFAVFADSFLLPGFVFYGGLFGGIIAANMYFKHFNMDGREYFDLVVPAIPLFHIFGRLGCFLGGCCYGIECDIGFVFHDSLSAPNGVSLFPVQLLEAFCNIIIFIVLVATKKRRKKGSALWLYLLMYAPMRFLVEFLRGDELRGGFIIFSTSQWISLIILIVLAIMFVKKKRSAYNNNNFEKTEG